MKPKDLRPPKAGHNYAPNIYRKLPMLHRTLPRPVSPLSRGVYKEPYSADDGRPILYAITRSGRCLLRGVVPRNRTTQEAVDWLWEQLDVRDRLPVRVFRSRYPSPWTERAMAMRLSSSSAERVAQTMASGFPERPSHLEAV